MTETTGHRAPAMPNLDWLMNQFVSTIPDVRAVQLSSIDGFKLASHGLADEERADYLSAIVSGHLPLFNGSLQKVTGLPNTRHVETVVNANDTIAIIASAGEGGILAALTEPTADVGMVGHELGELVKRVGEHLGVDPRVHHPTTTPGPLG
ncbi:roadblock/LC7 domain-containing protein [Streptomyces sp. TR02-1]|uniref:roadblock/LC7 domain-containing protein n=1 Tax=Streptomyces sp. TR02-1 TaxID=3385977 RepID=UPI0039A25FC2